MADHDRFGRDRYGRDERGLADRAGDEVRSWFGDDDAARRRRMDEREGERWRGEEPWRGEERARRAIADRSTGSSPAWGRERSYSSDREYGDRDYGWRSAERPRDWGPSGDYDAGYTPYTAERTYAARPGYARHEYTKPEYTEYGRGTYGGQYGREHGSREWSSEGWRVPGPHSGRGPRGYQRSDERIREELNDRLTAHGLIDATDVECHVQGGEVTLTGFVDSRAAKRAAEDLAEDVHGVREVHNQLRIRSHATGEGVGRTSVLGLTESQVQKPGTVEGPEGRPRAR